MPERAEFSAIAHQFCRDVEVAELQFPKCEGFQLSRISRSRVTSSREAEPASGGEPHLIRNGFGPPVSSRELSAAKFCLGELRNRNHTPFLDISAADAMFHKSTYCWTSANDQVRHKHFCARRLQEREINSEGEGEENGEGEIVP